MIPLGVLHSFARTFTFAAGTYSARKRARCGRSTAKMEWPSVRNIGY